MLFRADNDPHVIELKRFSRYYDGNPVFLTVRASSTGSLFNTYSSDGTAYTQVMAEVAALMPSILLEVHAGQFQSILPYVHLPRYCYLSTNIASPIPGCRQPHLPHLSSPSKRTSLSREVTLVI